MKLSWKKFTALALALCLFICALPPVAYAADSEAVSYTYDFVRGPSAYLTNGTKLGTINDYSMTENNRWKLAAQWGNNASVVISTVWALNMNFGGDKTPANYYAMYIKVPEAGEYDLTVTYRAGRYDTTSGVYIFPLSAVTADGVLSTDTLQTEVGTNKTESSYYVGCVVDKDIAGDGTYTSNSDKLPDDTEAGTTADLGKVTFDAAGEYVLAFNYLSGTDNYLYLRNIILTKEASEEPAPDKAAFLNFHLNGDSDFTWDDSGTLFDKKTMKATGAQSTAIKGYYDDEILNWYPLAFTTRNNQGTFGDPDRWNGVRLDTSSGTGYAAMIMRAPGAGEYNLTLNYELYTQGGAGEMYILPGDTPVDGIEQAMNAAKPVITFDCSGGETYGERAEKTGKYFFSADEEHVIVFKLTEGGSNGMLYLLSLEAEAVPVTFDFTEIAASHGLSLTGSNSCPEIKQAYAEDKTINWQFWYTYNCQASRMGGTADYDWSGLRIGAKPGGGYAVYYIRPTESGNYDLTVHYQTSKVMGDVSVYLLPNTDYEEFPGVVTSSTPIGAYSCYSDSANYVDAAKKMDTSVALKANTQYVVVFYVENTKESGAVYAAMNGITLTRKDAAFAVGESAYDTLEAAATAAADTDDKLVTLTDNIIVCDNYALPAGVTVDLNGHKLKSTGQLVAVEGNVVDSSDGNNGLLACTGGSVTFNSDNEDLPVWDYVNKAYSFFDYKLKSDICEPDGDDVTRQKFWFKFHFYTNDNCTTLDQDAYDLVKQGNSGIEIRTKLTWAGEYLRTAYFGYLNESGENDTDLFVKDWAHFTDKDTGDEIEAHDRRWLYVIVTGLEENLVGTLTVQPEIDANGVVISSEAMSYVSGS